MNKKISSKAISLTFGILVACFAIAFYVVAWEEPTSAPPEDNVAAPLNVGSDGQSKQGWLHTLKSLFIGDAPSVEEQGTSGILRTTGGAIFNTGGADTGLIVQQGDVCIGDDCRDSWPDTGVVTTSGSNPVCPEGYIPMMKHFTSATCGVDTNECNRSCTVGPGWGLSETSYSQYQTQGINQGGVDPNRPVCIYVYSCNGGLCYSNNWDKVLCAQE